MTVCVTEGPGLPSLSAGLREPLKRRAGKLAQPPPPEAQPPSLSSRARPALEKARASPGLGAPDWEGPLLSSSDVESRAGRMLSLKEARSSACRVEVGQL